MSLNGLITPCPHCHWSLHVPMHQRGRIEKPSFFFIKVYTIANTYFCLSWVASFSQPSIRCQIKSGDCGKFWFTVVFSPGVLNQAYLVTLCLPDQISKFANFFLAAGFLIKSLIHLHTMIFDKIPYSFTYYDFW